MKMRVSLVLCVLSMALLAMGTGLPDAHADITYRGAYSDGQSPITAVFELRLGPHTPGIDDEFNGQGPYSAIFGNRQPWLVEGEYDHQVYRGFGSAAVGFHLGLWQVRARALNEDGTRSPDRTSMLQVPVRLSAVYRFDVLQQRWNIPFVISLKAGFSYVFWRVRGADGPADVTSEDGDTIRSRGGTSGVHAGIGLHLLLNWFAPQMGRTFDANVGVNHSYLFAEYFVTKIDDFGGASSWNLSDKMLLFGIAFEF